MKGYLFGGNAETLWETIDWQFYCYTHGLNCVNKECFKKEYVDNITRITGVNPTVCRERSLWLWPYCSRCSIWICSICFNSCSKSGVPVEPLAINKGKGTCVCEFRRVCTAHFVRFSVFFPHCNLRNPFIHKYRASRSKYPLKEWCGILSEKHLLELEKDESKRL